MNAKIRIIFLGVLIIVVMVACNLPGQGIIDGLGISTPNLTMTALFAPPVNNLTQTVSHEGVSTATIEPPTIPTMTQPPPSSPTPEPSLTSSPTIASTATTSPSPTQSAIPNPTTKPVVIVVVPPTPTIIAMPPCSRSVEQFNSFWINYPATNYYAYNVVYGQKYWIGNSDLSATFNTAWDNQFLYLNIYVMDERYVQNANGADIYKGDSIEILFDSNLCGDITSTSFSRDDYQIGISAGNPNVNNDRYEVFKWYPQPAGDISTSVGVSSVKTNDGYEVHTNIPWSYFGIIPAAGQSFGFALSVSDNDDQSENKQESMVSAVAGRHLTNPATWGILNLR